MARKTALYDRHIALGGKMVEFAGYMLPVQYSGITLEHRAVRQEAGIFDVSHMGEFLFTGEGAEEALNRLLTNDIRGMRDGQARYSLMANERGGAVDDVIVGRERADKFWMVVNAANREKDYAHMEKFGDLGVRLPRNDQHITTKAGDVILSEGNLLVIYYAPNTWNFTRLGRVVNLTEKELKKVLGKGNITATLTLHTEQKGA